MATFYQANVTATNGSAFVEVNSSTDDIGILRERSFLQIGTNRIVEVKRGIAGTPDQIELAEAWDFTTTTDDAIAGPTAGDLAEAVAAIRSLNQQASDILENSLSREGDAFTDEIPVFGSDDTKLKSSDRKLSDFPRTLPDITSLSSLNPAALVDGQGFRVVSTGRAGDFAWRSGDQSSNVSGDPEEGIWVAPDSDPTGASGAFERIFDGVIWADWFGVDGSGATNSASAFQAALDTAEAMGGGKVMFSWPDSVYLIDGGIDIPDFVEFVGIGVPGITVGTQQFKCTTSTAAFRMKTGEGATSGSFRSTGLENVGVEVTAGSATAFRFRHGRDGMFKRCSARLAGNNQIGFHYQGEADGSSNRGVFDCTTIQCISYSPALEASSGNTHYKLSGTDGNGQCNANLFLGIRGGGGGKGIEIGPSNSNSFIMPEFEFITGDFVHILDGAFENGITDLYAEGYPDWSAFIMNVEVGAQRNYIDGYTAGGNVFPNDLNLQPNNYARWSAKARVYAANRTDNVLSARTSSSSEDDMKLSADGLLFGSGSSEPDKLFSSRLLSVTETDFSSADPSLTPDVSVSRMEWVRLLSGSSGTFTVNEPVGSLSAGDTFDLHVLNSSGGAISLALSGDFIVPGGWPASLPNGDRITARFARVGGIWVMIGAYAMG